MKLFVALIAFLNFYVSASAQYPKLIVRLNNKSNNSFSLTNPSQFLSPRAIDRRDRYNIPLDSSDLPLTTSYVDSIQNAGNVRVLSVSKWLNQVLIETTDQEAIKKILSYPFVASAKGIAYRATNPIVDKPETKRPVTLTPAERSFHVEGDALDYGNNYDQVHIHEGEFLHNRGFRGETMQVAVLDAGFLHYKELSTFDSVRSKGQILGEKDFVDYDNSVNEDDPHGMYCLSILSANWPGKMVGTAPKAAYWLIRTENTGSEYPIEEHNWVVGAEFADSAGADIISSSLGYSTFNDPAFNHSFDDFYKNTTMVSIGAAEAVKKGMIVSCSAGNEGDKTWTYICFPADNDSVCAVGAVDIAGNVAAFSSYGFPGKVKPNIVSVGSRTVIAGLNNQTVAASGTSFSNPNAVGLIACLWQAFPSFSNMKILDAVYKSSDRFNTPDDRHGYGIPNFKKAYKLLKHDQNLSVYGNEWFFVAPESFNDSIKSTFIGRLNGHAKVELINPLGKVIASYLVLTESEELYSYTFSNLGTHPPGFYTVKYSDSATTRSVVVQKGNVFEKDWLVAIPNPIKTDLMVYLKANEPGKADLRLIDAKGRIIEKVSVEALVNEVRTVRFNSIRSLPSGNYFLQYLSKSQKRTLRLIK